jgi:predicted PurR-regulated permease PerM
MAGSSEARREFVWRAGVVLGLLLLVAFFLWLFSAAAQVVLLAFAGVLTGVVLRGAAGRLASFTPLSPKAALIVVVVVLALVWAGSTVLVVPLVGPQIDELTEQIPESLEHLKNELSETSWGRWLLDAVPAPFDESSDDPAQDEPAQDEPSGEGSEDSGERSEGEPPGAAERGSARSGDASVGGSPEGSAGGSAGTDLSESWVARLTGIVSSTVGALVGLFVILIVGLYVAFGPDMYRDGFLSMLPPDKRRRAREVLDVCSHTLRGWFVAQLVSMGVIGTLSTIILYALDVPLALTLGIMAGLLTFIPNLGPLLALLPPTLLALMDSWTKAVAVVGLYVLVQIVESYLITPMVQKRVINLPPALTILAQVLVGVISGPLGLVLAAPMLALVQVLVRELWVKRWGADGEPAGQAA